MPIGFRFNEKGFKLVTSGIRFWMSLKEEVDVLYDNIVSIRQHLSGIDPAGFRCPGTNFPRKVAAGTYYTSCWPLRADYWNAVGSEQLVEIVLRHSAYERLVFGVTDAARVINDLQARRRRYMETEMSYQVEVRELVIPGNSVDISVTLSRPSGQENCPVVILVAGSGPTDRDWNSLLLPGNNGSGRLLAEVLTQHGYMVFRYDKRGIGKSTLKNSANSQTWNDQVMDLVHVVEFAKNFEGADANKIFVMGHSEGGLTTLKMMEDNSSLGVKGIVLLATPGRSFAQITLSQLSKQLSNILSEEALNTDLGNLERAFTQIIGKQRPLPSPESISGVAGVQNFYKMCVSPKNIGFMEEILGFHPSKALKKCDIPILLLSGEKDLQVHPIEDTTFLYKEASQMQKSEVTLSLVPDADHVLKHESRGYDELRPEASLTYNSSDRWLDETALGSILDWLKMQSALVFGNSSSAATVSRSKNY
ncbi:MAG: alpha/beta hydrolase family protein [Gammaproteobacteria bacterium]